MFGECDGSLVICELQLCPAAQSSYTLNPQPGGKQCEDRMLVEVPPLGMRLVLLARPRPRERHSNEFYRSGFRLFQGFKGEGFEKSKKSS